MATPLVTVSAIATAALPGAANGPRGAQIAARDSGCASARLPGRPRLRRWYLPLVPRNVHWQQLDPNAPRNRSLPSILINRYLQKEKKSHHGIGSVQFSTAMNLPRGGKCGGFGPCGRSCWKGVTHACSLGLQYIKVC